VWKSEAEDAKERPQEKAGNDAEQNGRNDRHRWPAGIEAEDHDAADQPEQEKLADDGSRSGNQVDAVWTVWSGSHFFLVYRGACFFASEDLGRQENRKPLTTNG
jgi:hypothetical protein